MKVIIKIYTTPGQRPCSLNCADTKNLKAEDSTAKNTLDDYTYISSPV